MSLKIFEIPLKISSPWHEYLPPDVRFLGAAHVLPDGPCLYVSGGECRSEQWEIGLVGCGGTVPPGLEDCCVAQVQHAPHFRPWFVYAKKVEGQ